MWVCVCVDIFICMYIYFNVILFVQVSFPTASSASVVLNSSKS